MLPEKFMSIKKLIAYFLGALLITPSLVLVSRSLVVPVKAATGCLYTEPFNTLPAWTSSMDASWGSPAEWSANGFLQATRAEAGSSANVRVYTVPPNTLLRLTVYMKGAAGSNYWTEAAYRLGNRDANDFDTRPWNWTLINKFDSFGDYPDGNDNVWMPYSIMVNTGPNDNLSLGYKAGSTTSEYPGGYWSNFSICLGNSPTPTPVPIPTPTPIPTCVADESFDILPTWDSVWNAPWGSTANWTATGYLKAVNPLPGSSSVVKVYPVAPNTNYTLEIAMYGTRSRQYWTETAFKLGTHSARDFDETASTWTLVHKLANPGPYPNGSGGVWAWANKSFYTEASSTVSVGFKAGSLNSSFPYPGGYWSNLSICANPPAFLPALQRPR